MCSLIPNGILFMWAPKEMLADVLKIASEWGFVFVEHYIWVHP